MNTRIRRLGLRGQVALLSAALLAVLIVVGGAVFYGTVRASLAQGFDTELRIHTDQIAGGVSLNDKGAVVVTDATGELLDLDMTPTPEAGAANGATPAPSTPTPATDATETPIADQATPAPPSNTGAAVSFGTLVRVLDAHGEAVYTSPAFRALSVPRGSITRALGGEDWRGTVQARNGQEVRLYSEPQFTDDGSVFAVVQVGESLAPLNATFGSVLVPLLLIFPPLLVLDVLGCYWLAGRAFRPLARLTRTAQHINAGAMHERVEVPASSTEVRRLATTFNGMLDRLADAFARQQRFVADASHELRTPVATIRSLSEVALSPDQAPHEIEAALRGVVDETERLSALISDLLLLARADEGYLSPHREPLQLDALVADVLATAAPLAAERDVQLDARLAPTLLLGDEARLIQMVMNLVENALHYTDAGGTVTVTTEAPPDGARLVVRDTGIGISPADQPRIFDRFYRADAARSRRTGGTGLGLALVAWVARAHGGTITVESAPGAGAAFTITLPYSGQRSETPEQ